MEDFSIIAKNNEFQKEVVGSHFEKGNYQEGVFADTPQNRKLGRVGQKYSIDKNGNKVVQNKSVDFSVLKHGQPKYENNPKKQNEEYEKQTNPNHSSESFDANEHLGPGNKAKMTDEGMQVVKEEENFTSLGEVNDKKISFDPKTKIYKIESLVAPGHSYSVRGKSYKEGEYKPTFYKKGMQDGRNAFLPLDSDTMKIDRSARQSRLVIDSIRGGGEFYNQIIENEKQAENPAPTSGTPHPANPNFIKTEDGKIVHKDLMKDFMNEDVNKNKKKIGEKEGNGDDKIKLSLIDTLREVGYDDESRGEIMDSMKNYESFRDTMGEYGMDSDEAIEFLVSGSGMSVNDVAKKIMESQEMSDPNTFNLSKKEIQEAGSSLGALTSVLDGHGFDSEDINQMIFDTLLPNTPITDKEEKGKRKDNYNSNRAEDKKQSAKYN